MVLFTSQSVSQVIVIYLFVQFSKPVSLAKDVKDENESDEEYEEISNRDPNLDMMYYVKNMPKMQRIQNVDYDLDKNKGALEYLFE